MDFHHIFCIKIYTFFLSNSETLVLKVHLFFGVAILVGLFTIAKPYKPKPKRVGSFSRFNFQFPSSFSLSLEEHFAPKFHRFLSQISFEPSFLPSIFILLSVKCYLLQSLLLFSDFYNVTQKKILNILNLLVIIFSNFSFKIS